MSGFLYVCGTPIGNLEDISPRLKKTLSEVDLIICEDTRQTIKLINHLGLSKKLISYHQHNESKQSEYITDLIIEGKNIALVSDAGMPCISDPGSVVVKKAIDKNITVIPISGPSAFILALVASGFDSDTFLYYGFIDRDKEKRKRFFQDILTQNKTMVFYESPHKLLKTLNEILVKIGDINVCIAREITKKFEEFYRGSISQGIEHFSSKDIKGEFCLVLEAFEKKEEFSADKLKNFATKKIDEGLSKKQISKLIAEEFGISSKEAYDFLLKL